jgi:hypothetical protein
MARVYTGLVYALLAIVALQSSHCRLIDNVVQHDTDASWPALQPHQTSRPDNEHRTLQPQGTWFQQLSSSASAALNTLGTLLQHRLQFPGSSDDVAAGDAHHTASRPGQPTSHSLSSSTSVPAGHISHAHGSRRRQLLNTMSAIRERYHQALSAHSDSASSSSSSSAISSSIYEAWHTAHHDLRQALALRQATLPEAHSSQADGSTADQPTTAGPAREQGTLQAEDHGSAGSSRQQHASSAGPAEEGWVEEAAEQRQHSAGTRQGRQLAQRRRGRRGSRGATGVATVNPVSIRDIGVGKRLHAVECV